MDLADINALAGIASLVNSLIMWPMLRSLKRLEPRVATLEEDKAKRDTVIAKLRRPRHGAI